MSFFPFTSLHPLLELSRKRVLRYEPSNCSRLQRVLNFIVDAHPRYDDEAIPNFVVANIFLRDNSWIFVYVLIFLQDIRNQRRYRQRRRQEKKKLGQTLESLQSKSQFYEEQIDYYNQYIRVCLDNLSNKGK